MSKSQIAIDKDKDSKMFNKKIGIRIFKGSASKNIALTLRNEVNLDNLNKIKNELLSQKLTELAKEDSHVYAWAALRNIEKHISYGEKIIFIIVETRELFIFDYVDSIFDKNSEFQKLIAKWRGTGFEEIVFLRNKQEIKLGEEQIEGIKELSHAVYKHKGRRSRYENDNVLYGESVDKLSKILNIKF